MAPPPISDWQSLEDRLGTSPSTATAERQQVWGLRYIDDLILRDRDTTGDGTPDERLYACQDANWNMVALFDTSATAQERNLYSPFGMPTFMDGTMSTMRSTSAVDSEILFTDQRFDLLTLMHLFRGRWFDSITGRFISRDPLRYVDGPNTYAGWFVPGAMDPFGLQPERIPNPRPMPQPLRIWPEPQPTPQPPQPIPAHRPWSVPPLLLNPIVLATGIVLGFPTPCGDAEIRPQPKSEKSCAKNHKTLPACPFGPLLTMEGIIPLTMGLNLRDVEYVRGDLEKKHQCPRGPGNHFNIYAREYVMPWVPQRKTYGAPAKGRFIGSVVCCKCCTDTPAGPVVSEECQAHDKHEVNDDWNKWKDAPPGFRVFTPGI